MSPMKCLLTLSVAASVAGCGSAFRGEPERSFVAERDIAKYVVSKALNDQDLTALAGRRPCATGWCSLESPSWTRSTSTSSGRCLESFVRLRAIIT